MPPGRVLIPLIPGLPGRPVEQRNVQQAVNDQPVIIPGSKRSPGLDETARFPEPFHQLIRSQKPGPPGRPGAGQLVSGHAGEGVEETQIVVIQLDALFHPV